MLKVLELFAGIGACSKALDRLGIEHEIVDAVEIDKYAIKGFNAIHGTNFEVQDITKWDKDLDVDLIMHGSPCQDFSVAGKQAGGDIGSGTRSSLMYETIRIVGKLRPKYVVWENVKNLLSKKHKHNFDAYIETMNILGYNSYYQVLNAKDYGIPQNRERIFTISIRKDIDGGNFKFPEKEPLKLRLKDMLEKQVDKKYYLSDTQIANFKANGNGNCNPSGKGMNGQVCCNDISPTLTTNKGEGIKIHETNVVGNLEMDKWQDHMKRIYDVNSYAPTLGTMQGGNTEPKILEDSKCIQVGQLDSTYDQSGRIYAPEGISPTIMSNSHIGGYTAHKILVKNATKKGYDEAIDGDSMGVVEKEYERTPLKFLNRNQKNIDGDYAFCVDSCNTGGVKEIEGTNLRIRKLTPKECWRLMGFDDEDFEKAEKVNSNTQLYKQAGNSIVVNVLEKIFKNLLEV